MFDSSKAFNLLNQLLIKILESPLMHQKIHNTKMPKAMCSKNTFSLETSKKKHVSYSQHDGHILEIEKQLMSKYHVGYSGLHKMLILKEGNNQFARPYV